MVLNKVNKGDVISSEQWNKLIDAIESLQKEKVNRGGDIIQGAVEIQGKVKAKEYDGLDIFHKGMIIMWSGKKEDIPDGWIVCDGSDKRAPDLSERFIRCVSKKAEEVYTDGADEASYKLTKEMVPNHSHKISCNQNSSIEHKVYLRYYHPMGTAYHGVGFYIRDNNSNNTGMYLNYLDGQHDNIFSYELPIENNTHQHDHEVYIDDNEESLNKEIQTLPYPKYYALFFIMYVGK